MKKTRMIALLLALVLVLGACAPAAQKSEQKMDDQKSEQKMDDKMSEEKKDDKMSEEKKDDKMSEEKKDDNMMEAGTEMVELTLEELAKFNGKDGQKAYIAVDGVIYDVTEHPAWKDGGHNGAEAGKDLTDVIKNQSPHGVSKLDGLTPVGKLK